MNHKVFRGSQIGDLIGQIGDSSISLAYGHFSLLHPGHIRYLKFAKSLSDKLIAVVYDSSEGQTSEFSPLDVAEVLATVVWVDFVLVLDDLSLADAISDLGNVTLVVGNEHKETLRSDLLQAQTSLKKVRGHVVYHAANVEYSRQSHTEHISVVNTEAVKSLRQLLTKEKLSFDSLIESVNNFENAKILIIGDSIVDRYTACDPLGLSSEAPVIVVKEIQDRTYIGGAAIVAAHVSQLGADAFFLSVVGDDLQGDFLRKSLDSLKIKHFLFTDKSRATTLKTRFVVDDQKLFRTSRLDDHPLGPEVEAEYLAKLRELAPHYDAILVSDFSYGVISQNILSELPNIAKEYNVKLFGDSQSSSQVGQIGAFDLFDVITPTEKEARIAINEKDNSVEWVATHLQEKTKAKTLVLKLGANGFISYSRDERGRSMRNYYPALTQLPIDVAGAGDSLIAAISAGLVSGSSHIASMSLGACVAALAVRLRGNVPISATSLKNFLAALERVDIEPHLNI